MKKSIILSGLFAFGIIGCSILGYQSQPTASIPVTPVPTMTLPIPIEVVPTDTPLATETAVSPQPQLTQTSGVEPTIGPPVPPKPTEKPRIWFIPQPGTPLGMTNIVHPELGCTWMGVGGQVFGSDGAPLSELVIELGGTLNGVAVNDLALSGGSSLIGPGGFEFKLANQPLESNGTLWLLLHDLNGNVASARQYFNTYQDCERNFIQFNFNQRVLQTETLIFLPLIFKARR